AVTRVALDADRRVVVAGTQAEAPEPPGDVAGADARALEQDAGDADHDRERDQDREQQDHLAPPSRRPRSKSRLGRSTPATRIRSMQRGMIPVASNAPTTRPASSNPVGTNRKISCIDTTGPSMPTISWTDRILREPSAMRDTCTISSIADATCSRIALSGSA